MKKLYVVFLIASAIIFGDYLGNLVAYTEGLKFLNVGKTFGFSPSTFNLGDVIEFTFGISFSMNIAQVLFIITAIILYTKTAPKIFK